MSRPGRSERPLGGATVVVTRPADQAGDLVDALRSRGAIVVVVPVIAIEPVDARSARPDPAAFDWVAFTSANGVRHFVGDEGDAALFGSARLAAIGPATADAMAAAGVAADLVSPVHTASGLCDALVTAGPDGGRVLVPQGEAARPTLVQGLRAAGWVVEPVTVYRTVTAAPPGDAIAAATDADVITFASPSALRAFLRLVGPDRMPPAVATIGPVTSRAARAAGIEVDVEADPHSTTGLVDALVRWRRRESGPGAVDSTRRSDPGFRNRSGRA